MKIYLKPDFLDEMSIAWERLGKLVPRFDRRHFRKIAEPVHPRENDLKMQVYLDMLRDRGTEQSVLKPEQISFAGTAIEIE